MAELTHPLKRSREEGEDNNITKRQKPSYNDILSILEDEEEEVLPDSDTGLIVSGSDIFTTLQEELGFLPEKVSGFESDPVEPTGSGLTDSEGASNSVIRHLLEASDDELGIPSGDGIINGGDSLQLDEENGINGGDESVFPFAISDGLWEFEDEAANYYSLFQSELFM